MNGHTMNAALHRYRAAVELEAARDNLRILIAVGLNTGADCRRVQQAETIWSRARSGRSA